VLSERLETLLEDIAAGRAPNAGRFCGYCYNPLAPERQACPTCGRATAEWAPAEHIPREVTEMYRKARSREGTAVRTIAWGGLTLGVALALVPLAFGGVQWWTVGLFFGIMVFFYILSANLANSVGDAVGYAWGQSILRKRWGRFVAEREREPGARSQEQGARSREPGARSQ
jgi:hypothetical protein